MSDAWSGSCFGFIKYDIGNWFQETILCSPIVAIILRV